MRRHFIFFFFFSSRRRHTRFSRDWSSDVCSSDLVRVACLAQLVNVIAPIVTNANGVLRQSIYYPFAWALESARGQALDAWVDSAVIEGIPAIDSAATFDGATGQYCVLMLNRDLTQQRD